jgi:nucleoside-diphosphate-sugar epimerase
MLVTGAAGFIGSHLAERLLADGYRVIGIDSFTDHYQRHLKELNIDKLVGEPRFELVQADVAREPIAHLLDDVEVVFHLAARPGVRESWSDFEGYVESNIVGSKAVFEAAATSKVRVVYASSSSVYGDALTLPTRETDPLAPVSPYGASKVMTEALASAYSASYGLEAVGLRYFSVYGPRQRPDMGLSRFLEALIRNEPISVYGDGLQRRDMTYVGDVVDATLAAAEHGHRQTVYNVASGAPITLLQILGELAKVLDSPLKLVHEAARLGDVRDTWGDAAKAANDLGYVPSVSLREGLERQVAEATKRHALLVGR